ncbi:hypothetical protein ACFWHR_07570 [Leucobacter sp. NPDC058333]|uniref:hypothetical protein n=1 Tax=Leucobacter sp. NPDC058333 TaxID=3346450 RepID=UPI00364F47CA
MTFYHPGETPEELIEEAREAVARINPDHYNACFQYKGGVMWRGAEKILADVVDALEAALARRAEGEDHAATVTGRVGEHARDHMGICRNCGAGLSAMDILDGELPCAATVTGDREKLIAEAQAVGKYLADPEYYEYRLIARLADALAAPFEVDEAKLANAIADELGTDSWISRALSNGRVNATARRLVEFAVKPVLRGEGR